MSDRTFQTASVIAAWWTIAIMGLWGLAVLPASGSVITVCWDGSGDYLTIQGGIDAATDGDEVLVCAGRYAGPGNRDLDFRGRAIVLRSINPDDPEIVAATVIDCRGSKQDRHYAFRFHSGEDSKSVVAGFTIVTDGAANGGPIRCDGASPTIRDTVITIGTSKGQGDKVGFEDEPPPPTQNNEAAGGSGDTGRGDGPASDGATRDGKGLAGRLFDGEANPRDPVESMPPVPDPLWAVHALFDHNGQSLAAHYYLRLRRLEKAPWRTYLEEMAGLPGSGGRLLTKAELRRPIEQFLRRCKKDPLEALDGLGEFLKVNPQSIKLVLQHKKCRSAIREVLKGIESGCAHCLGKGEVPCHACKGRGRRVEWRTCKACNGSGGRPCPECNGTGTIVCPRCKGRGTVFKWVNSHNRILKRRIEVTCPTCGGSTRLDCPKCKGGTLVCTECKGTGRKESIGPCSVCKGHGHLPCPTCHASGRREDMIATEREKIEKKLARFLSAPAEPDTTLVRRGEAPAEATAESRVRPR
ncbi:MAG: hypothetical protein JXQ75_14970 [Phycisphaerae bacterium]|nr:hypothetical protein [Phycisphaerae bacterium]